MRASQVFLLAAFVTASQAAVAIMKAEPGEFVQLDLGPNIAKWSRTLDGGHKQHLKACDDENTDNKCIHWTDEEGKIVSEGSVARVHRNGTLTINAFTQKDVGAYYSNDEMERVTENDDGTFFALPRTLINVVL